MALHLQKGLFDLFSSRGLVPVFVLLLKFLKMGASERNVSSNNNTALLASS